MNEKKHGGFRDGAGRKPVDNPKKQRAIAATDDEWQQLKEIAKSKGKSLSDYLITKGLEQNLKLNQKAKRLPI